jgi:hypothetical protein
LKRTQRRRVRRTDAQRVAPPACATVGRWRTKHVERPRGCQRRRSNVDELGEEPVSTGRPSCDAEATSAEAMTQPCSCARLEMRSLPSRSPQTRAWSNVPLLSPDCPSRGPAYSALHGRACSSASRPLTMPLWAVRSAQSPEHAKSDDCAKHGAQKDVLGCPTRLPFLSRGLARVVQCVLVLGRRELEALPKESRSRKVSRRSLPKTNLSRLFGRKGM